MQNRRSRRKKRNGRFLSTPKTSLVFRFTCEHFTLTPGKKLSFIVAHESENLTVTAEVLRKEHLSIEAGEFDTVVVKPKIELNGVFKPVGDILIWLTDDDRKLIVRIESKIKIGTIVGVAKKIEP